MELPNDSITPIAGGPRGPGHHGEGGEGRRQGCGLRLLQVPLPSKGKLRLFDGPSEHH